MQSVNATERTAAILFPDTGVIDLASLLELDPHGASDLNTMVPHPASEGLGVRRGDFVFIHREGTTNGFEKPRLPRIGELEAWVREDHSIDGHLSGWRKEMSDLGTRIAARRGVDETQEGQMKQPINGDGSLLWFGEVTSVRDISCSYPAALHSYYVVLGQLNLDGSVEVTHPDLTIMTYPLERLTKLYDGIEQLEDDLWGDDMSDSHDSHGPENVEQIWSMDEDGTWQPDHTDGDEWEELDDDEDHDDHMDIDPEGWADETTLPLINIAQTPPVTLPISTSRPETPRVNTIAKSSAPPVERPPSPSVSKDTADEPNLDEDSDTEALPWKRFDVLPSAPVDHAYYSSPPAQPSKTFLGRLTREYRVLASSLPGSWSELICLSWAYSGLI